jgi:hypothetical protein
LIDLAPGAEHNPLAARLAELIRQSVHDDPTVARAFASLKSTILIVPFDTGDAVTLRFDLGRLVIHDGNVGIPSITFGGPSQALAKLGEARIPRLADLPRSRRGLGGVREALRLFASGQVKIYGWWVHPRTVVRFLRLVAPAGALPGGSA